MKAKLFTISLTSFVLFGLTYIIFKDVKLAGIISIIGLNRIIGVIEYNKLYNKLHTMKTELDNQEILLSSTLKQLRQLKDLHQINDVIFTKKVYESELELQK